MSTRHVLITGAARGLGRAMALHLAAPGTRLLLHHHTSTDAAAELAEEVARRGAEPLPVQADLAEPAGREALAAAAAEPDGALHVLIHNAAIYRPERLLESGAATFRETLEVNCTAVYHLTALCVPLLARGAPARVINLGDSGNDRVRARPQATAYHISKLGLHVLTRSFARELAPQGITVNQISPGILENSIDGSDTPIPAGRPGAFADVLGALDYLLSPGAAYVSGTNLVVSGGWNL